MSQIANIKYFHDEYFGRKLPTPETMMEARIKAEENGHFFAPDGRCMAKYTRSPGKGLKPRAPFKGVK